MKTAQEFRDFFAAIPEEKWCELEYVDKSGRKCVLGHLGATHGRNGGPDADALRHIFEDNFGTNPVTVNNGWYEPFPGSNPRARILAALDEIIAKEQSNKPKE